MSDYHVHIAESADALVVRLDPDGLMIEVDRRLPALLGWASGDLAGTSFLDLIHPDDHDATRAALDRLAAKQATHIANRCRTGSGDYLRIDWTFLAAQAPTGSAETIYAIAKAVVTQERRRASTEDNTSNAVGRAKSEFLASMSHELRTPLNAILGYTELLSSDESLSLDQREAAEAIRKSGEHLLMLITDILDFAKLDADRLVLTPHEFLFEDFLRPLLDMFEARAQQKGIRFIYRCRTALPGVIRCDETRLRQILLNLLSNAIKFTEEGSVVFTLSYESGTLRFQVEDTGIGIPESQLEAVFQPFEQAHGSRGYIEGTGLGLSISSRLVAMMGGELHVTSELGKGSTFWFEITPELISELSGTRLSYRVMESAEPSPNPAPDISPDHDEHLLSPEHLRRIHGAASIGDIRQILTTLQEIGINGETVQSQPSSSLVAEIYRLAKSFRGKQIKERVASLVE